MNRQILTSCSLFSFKKIGISRYSSRISLNSPSNIMDHSTTPLDHSIITTDVHEFESFGWGDFPLLMLSSQHHEAELQEHVGWGQFCDPAPLDLTVFQQLPPRQDCFALRNEVLSTIPEETEEKIVPVKTFAKRINRNSEKTKQMLCLFEPSRKRTMNALHRNAITKAVKRASLRTQQRRLGLMPRDD